MVEGTASNPTEQSITCKVKLPGPLMNCIYIYMMIQRQL